MPRYRVTLKYPDGDTRVVGVNADSEDEAKALIEKMAERQLADPFWGGDREHGMPKAVKAEKE
jgi:hypothetical protein